MVFVLLFSLFLFFFFFVLLFVVAEFDDAQFTSPVAFGWRLQRWTKAVHVVPSIAVIAEKELIVIVGCSANRAAFALYALPGIFAHGDDHVVGEL